MSATLGGLLKDYRLQKNIPQLEIAFALGWKDPTRLSRIEQGIVEKPPRDLVDKICRILQLSVRETNNLLLAGNYLPTIEEIEKTREDIKPVLHAWKYPAIALDFSWRMIAENEKNELLFRHSNFKSKVNIELPNVLEYIFHPNFPMNTVKGKGAEDWHSWLQFVLIHFKNIQQTRTKEKWYLELIKKMMDNDLFREYWQKAQGVELPFKVSNHGKKVFINPDNPKKLLNFNFFVVPLYDDPRFTVEFFNPDDVDTFKYFTQ